jgi:hypothetical protein
MKPMAVPNSALRARRHRNRFIVALTVALLAVWLMPGCAVLADRRTVAACKMADSVTTYDALNHGAVETNPFLSDAKPAAHLAIGALFAWLFMKILPEYKDMTKGERMIAGAGSVLFCGAAINNYNVSQKQRAAGK